MPWLVVAPHLDDAALGCGAVLATAAAAGCDIVVATAFAGDPADVPAAARSFHADCGLPDEEAVKLRRQEDLDACAALGVTARHLSLADAIYRHVGDRPLAADSADVLGARAADEPEVVTLVQQAICALVNELQPDRIWTCAAVSPHVDHEIVRLAALAELGDQVALWEDYPVAGEARADWSPPPGWVRAIEPVTEWGWERQLDSVACYPSQVRMLFGLDDLRARLEERAARDADGHVIVPFWRAAGPRP